MPPKFQFLLQSRFWLKDKKFSDKEIFLVGNLKRDDKELLNYYYVNWGPRLFTYDILIFWSIKWRKPLLLIILFIKLRNYKFWNQNPGTDLVPRRRGLKFPEKYIKGGVQNRKKSAENSALGCRSPYLGSVQCSAVF